MPSRIVCFVCGSLGGEYPLNSRIRESGAYFPFLEHHEPPKGSRIPGSDGVVDSCRVCYAFLTQQWETYERSNTPAIKRLYWLKRLDDGQFTGAEMKLQGEYMAQVMGLQYQPACGDSCAPLSPDESTSYSRDGFGSSSGREQRKQQDFGDGVLDLSIPVKLEPVPAPVTKASKRHQSQSHQEEKGGGSKASHSKPSVDEYIFVCYTCGTENQGVMAKFISSKQHPDYEQFYPFLSKLTPPKRAVPLSSKGTCQVCDHCNSSLRHQWLSYEHHGTPNSARIFKVNGFFFSNDSSISMAASSGDVQSNCIETCYLCSQSYPQSKLCPLFTSLSSGQGDQMYFPFIRELRRPNRARPLNPDGSVRVCVNCFRNLQNQWQYYEAEKINILMRRYSLLPSGNISSEANPIKPRSDTASSSLSMFPSSEPSCKSPINVETTKTPQSPIKLIASSNGNSLLVSSADQARMSVGGGGDSKATLTQPIPHPLLQAGERPKKVCFICGEKCLVSKMQILYSYPAKHEAKTPGGQLQSIPFFPFLANREPAPHAEPMTEEGTVTAGPYCFYSLLSQWRDFEESKIAADKNCWLRKYVTNEFMCFVCSLSVKRKKMRTLEVQKFQFLREHKAPHGALVMWGGEAVGACRSCHFSLAHQYAEYERLGVPLEHRKYNWTVQNPTNVNENSCDGPEHGQGQTSSGNEDSNLSMEDTIGPLPPGHPSKPPFSMINPGAMPTVGSAAGGKLPLKTATVPPLNQVSPSNGLPPGSRGTPNQTSSFAAALRKLAHQAKDPSEEVSLKSNHSPPAAHSPRSTTPKRSSHPLAFSSHSLPSTLPAPPVVTIAPTPAHHHSQSRVDSTRQALDLMSSSHGMSYGGVSSNSKSEVAAREQHLASHTAASSHSREEELQRSLRESPLSRAPSRLYPQTTVANGLSSLTSQALDMYNLGYNPYRLEEEAAAHHGLSLPYGIDPAAYAAAAAAAAYHPALLQQHPAFLPSPFRLDDPLLLERYRLLQSPYFPFSMGTGLMPSHPAAGSLGVHSLLASAAAAGQRYPAELLQQQYQNLSPLHPLMDPRLAAQSALLERSRMEEDKATRDKERERELEQEKREYESDRPRTSSRHGVEARESGYGLVDRSKADLLTIPTRAVHPLGRDPGSRRYQHEEQEARNGRSASPPPPSSKHREAYQAPNHRSEHHSAISPNNAIHTSRAHLDHHSHGKSPSAAIFSSNDKSATTASISSHHHPIQGGVRQHSHHHVKVGSHDHYEPSSSVFNRVKQHSSHSVSPSKVSYASSSLSSSSSSSSQNHLEKKPKPSELSRIFRPFDEPKASPVAEKGSANKKSSRSDLISYQLPTGRAAPMDVSSSHFPLTRASLHDSKPSDLLSIPVLRVPPQTHSIPSSRSFFPVSSLVESKAASPTPPPPPPLSSAVPVPSSKPLSHCINDRIERFDFKSLARECTSSSSPAIGSECSEIHPAAMMTSAFLEENRPRECVSKLDLEEKHQRENENCVGNGDVVDEEERMMAHLTMVGRATPILLDESADKVAMLRAVGLTTRTKKKELLLKKEARRRRHQRLSSLSPVLQMVDQTPEFQSQASVSRDQLCQRLLRNYPLVDPSRLNKEPDVAEKGAFLKNLGLGSSSHSHIAECDAYLKRKHSEMMSSGAAASDKVTAVTELTKSSSSFPSFSHSSSKRHRGSRLAPTLRQPSSGHPELNSNASQSVANPSVIFSNVDSWLENNRGRGGLKEKHRKPSATLLFHPPHSSADSQAKDHHRASLPASVTFPYKKNKSRTEGTNSHLPISVPSLPLQWNTGSNNIKSEQSLLLPEATRVPENSRDLTCSTAANPFTHSVPATFPADDKHRLDSSQGRDYELSLKNLKSEYHNYR